MHNLIGDPKAVALLAVMGVLLLLCGAFGFVLFLRLRRGEHPVRLTVRNVSIGGVTGGYEFSDTLVLFACFVLTLGLLAGVCLRLRPENKPANPADDGRTGIQVNTSAACPPSQAPAAASKPAEAHP